MKNALAGSIVAYNYVWINGNLVKIESTSISLLTHSLHYSGAVFEGEKAYNGKIFKLKQHTIRLLKSAESLKLQVPFTYEEIIAAHELMIKKNKIQDAYIRPLIWRGSESLNIINSNLLVNICIVAVPSIPREAKEGIKLHIGELRKIPPNSLPVQAKSSAHYVSSIISKTQAKELGYDDALLLDQQGNIAEGTTANVFFFKDNILYTPIADVFLNGITRQTVIEDVAQKLGLEVKEERIKLEHIKNFDECFLTGTAAEIQKVQSIDLNIDDNLNYQNLSYQAIKNTNYLRKQFIQSKITDQVKEEYIKLVHE